MPAYVANSERLDTGAGSDGFAPLRFSYRDWRQPPPLGVDMKSRFRPHKRANASCCQLPAALDAIWQMVDRALASAVALVEGIMTEEENMYGSEGANAGMRRALAAMCRCFDWARLVPAGGLLAEDADEFGVLYALMRRYMGKTLWPSGAAFARVVHGWPGAQEAKMQYVVLVRRVRSAAKVRGEGKRNWWVLQGYTVEPIREFASVAWFVDAMCRDAAPCLRRRIASVISACLGKGIADWDRRIFAREAGHAPQAAHPFFITQQYVVKCGFVINRGLRAGRQTRERRSYAPSPGGVATLALPSGGCLGKLVYVRAAKYELDPSLISASIDSDPYFALGKEGSGFPAWHAARLHHRCRSMGSSEAVCERIGSLLQRAWQPRCDVNAVMDGVFLDSAGVLCIGGERDAMVAAEVTECLSMARRRPHVTAQYRARRRRAGIAVSHSVQGGRREAQERLEASGRQADDGGDSDQGDAQEAAWWRGAIHSASDLADFRRDRKRVAPRALCSTRVDHALQANVTHSKAVAAQPWLLQRADGAAASSSAAGSVTRQKLKSWLDSADGLQWRRDRAAMFAAKGIDVADPAAGAEDAGPTAAKSAKAKEPREAVAAEKAGKDTKKAPMKDKKKAGKEKKKTCSPEGRAATRRDRARQGNPEGRTATHRGRASG